MQARKWNERIVFMLALFCLASYVHAQTPVDLNTWSQQGQPTQSTWNVAPDGASVLQTINGGVGLFVSPDNFFNTTIEGSFGVETTSDDDFIGFVFGYQAPINETTTLGQTTVDFLLFDWKQTAQSGAQAGFRLSYVEGTHKGTSSDVTHELWTHTSSAGLTVTPLGTDTGAGRGWQEPVGGAPVVYDFTLLYTTDQIKIDVAGGQLGAGETIFDIAFADLDSATQALFAGGAFQDGRFGFYNYSQQSVRYQSFTLTEPELATVPGDGGTLNFVARVGDSDSQSVNVSNTGGAGSLLTGTAGSPSGAPFSGPSESANYSLGAGDDTDFTYTFAPNARGASNDSVQIQSNQDATHTINFAGLGVGPVFDSSVPPGSTIDLGDTPPSTSSDTPLRIANLTPDENGGDHNLTNLTLSSVITGDDAALFSVDLVDGTVINKSGALDILITFLGEDTPDTYTATLTLLTDEGAALGNTGGGQSYSFDLSATVVPEPAMLPLLALGAAAALKRRPR